MEGRRRRRSVDLVSQVGVFLPTGDGFLFLWPICVAGQGKNGDLRRKMSEPATVRTKNPANPTTVLYHGGPFWWDGQRLGHARRRMSLQGRASYPVLPGA